MQIKHLICVGLYDIIRQIVYWVGVILQDEKIEKKNGNAYVLTKTHYMRFFIYSTMAYGKDPVMVYKKKRRVIALILLITVTVTACSKHQNEEKIFTTNHEQNSLPAKERLNDLQWWLNNDATFSKFDDSKNAWGTDKKRAVNGVDLNIGPKSDGIDQKRPVLIALLDSGIDIYHPSIAKSIYVNKNEIPDDNVDNDTNGYVDDYLGWNFYDGNNNISSSKKSELAHATATASILIGNDLGTGYTSALSKYDAKILCIKVLGGKSNSGSLTNIIEAIHYAENMGVSICGLAINTDIDNQEFMEAVQTSKMLFVVSAGNEGINMDKYGDNYPSCYQLPNVISVADLRCDGNLSTTSNYGQQYVDIAAPGTNILCAKPGGGYEFLSGTSLSVYSIVSEAGLIYIETEKVSTAQQIKKIILNNVASLESLNDKVASNGMPDFEKAIDNAH